MYGVEILNFQTHEVIFKRIADQFNQGIIRIVQVDVVLDKKKKEIIILIRMGPTYL